MVLLKHLPRESPFKQAVDPAMNGWSATEHLLALQIDEYRAAHGVEQRVRRPGDPDPEEKTRAVRETMRARFEARQREREQQQQRDDDEGR